MATLRHPIGGATYSGEGATVHVQDRERWGRFDADGRWLAGDLKSADPQMCRWIVSDWLLGRDPREALDALEGVAKDGAAHD